MGSSRVANSLLLAARILQHGAAALPKDIISASQLERRDDWAAVAAYKPSSAHWTTEVTGGGQVLNLLVDTGSADL